MGDLLAKDEMDTNDDDVVHLLAGPLHKTNVDNNALPVAKLKITAQAEIDRILASRDVSAILGDGSEKEYHRIVHLLHPDKGLVSRDDPRANQALRLAFAARRATRICARFCRTRRLPDYALSSPNLYSGFAT